MGKRADLVVLAASPLAVEPGDLADIDIVETISRDRTIYQSPDYFADRSSDGTRRRASFRACRLFGAPVILKH